LALDEPKAGDHIFEADGFTFVMSRDVRELTGEAITIDGSYMGMRILSRLDPDGSSRHCS
jgi:hypothetical protein